MENKMVPPEIEGKNTNLHTSVELDTKDEAADTFNSARKRLLTPPLWHQLCGPVSAEFILTGDSGEIENRLAKEGDYVRIDIPGPGPSSGDGYDWVCVELIEEKSNPDEEEESCGMKLRAAPKPGKKGIESAHFFQGKSTSSFIIRRKGNTVMASYHGRNELPNTDTENFSDKIRNSMVAMGAYAFLSELQWSALIKGFLEKEIRS